MKTWFIVYSLLLTIFSCGMNPLFADTPPPGSVLIKGGTDGTKIGNVGDALKVNVTSGGGGTVNQGTGGLSPWLVTVNNSSIPVTGTFFQSVQPVSQSGSWTVASTQSGSWTTGRTWTLGHSTDSVSSWLFDGSGNSLSSTSNALNVDVTNTVPVTGTFFQSVQPVSQSGSWTVAATQSTSPWIISGSVTANAGTGNFTVVQGTGSNLHADIDNFPATQPVSGTVAVTQSTSPWVSNVSQFGGSNVVTGTGASGSGIPRVTVSNDSNILATQSGTWNINNVSGTVSLPTGASTSANQTNGNQITQVSSLPSIPAGSNNIGSITNITGTVSLPTGAATSANQTNGNQKTQVTANVTAPDVTTTGSITAACVTPSSCGAGSTVTLTANGVGSILVNVQGTFSANLIGEGSNDGGTTWSQRKTYISGILSTSPITAASYNRFVGFAGYELVRVRATSYTSGTANVTISASTGSDTVTVLNTNAANLLEQSWTYDGSGNAINSTANALNVNVSSGYSTGQPVLSTFTQSYSSVNLTTGAFVTIISSTSSQINSEDIFDNSGGLWYLAYAATCGALSNASNAIIIGPGGGGKNFLIPSGNCVGFEALGSNITSGNVYMTFYK